MFNIFLVVAGYFWLKFGFVLKTKGLLEEVKKLDKKIKIMKIIFSLIIFACLSIVIIFLLYVVFEKK